MSDWDFVTMAYAIGIGGTVLIVALSWLGLKRAEGRLDDLKRN